MILKDYLSIGGEHGLFKFIAQGRNAIVVEHLESGKRSSAFGSAKVSSLEDISIFTEGEDMPLSKVFDMIHEKASGGEAVDPKTDNEGLKKWFGDVLPEYDRERVYPSDIRKVALWYNTLHKLGLLVKEDPEAEKNTEGEKEGNAPSLKDVKAATNQSKSRPKETKATGKTESKSAAFKPKGAPKAK
ncbi:MAG: DUF5606 domain-containing protein [Bacteroidales bacterium]